VDPVGRTQGVRRLQGVASAVGRVVACCESGRMAVAVARAVLLVCQHPSNAAAHGRDAAI